MHTNPALTLVTDPELIEVLEQDHLSGSLALPHATKVGDVWWAYAEDVRKYLWHKHRNPLEAQ